MTLRIRERGRLSKRPPAAAASLCAALLALLLSPAPEAKQVSSPAWQWLGVERVVAFGDVHGSFDEVRAALHELDLVDEDLSWTGGKTHLVFNGDLLDRGLDERNLVDLIRKLQPEALAAGGRVHVLLGNHDLMALVRDTRYTKKEAYAEFADLEDPEDRRKAFERYLRAMRDTGMPEEQLRKAFDLANPPGYYGRMRAFGPGGEYATWLMRQSVIIRINETVFVHAGLTEEVAVLGLDEINRSVMNDVREFWNAREVLEDSGEVEEFATYREVQKIARDIVAHKGIQRVPDIQDAAERVTRFLDSLAVVSDGPLWYRGNSLENERVERIRLEEVLSLLEADRMVVGHTTTRSGRITSRFDGQLVKTDTGLYKNRNPQVLVLEDRGCRVFDPGTGRYVSTTLEAPQGEAAAMAYTTYGDPYLERFLEKANVEESRPLGRGSTRPLLLQLNDGGERMRALFKYVQEGPETRSVNGIDFEVSDRYQHEIAAYRLDRMLGLEMVPVTGSRWFGSRGKGSIQRWVDAALDHRTAQARILGGKYHEQIAGHWDRMKVFDGLIGNPDRRDTDILHVTRKKKVILVDHSKAFSPTPVLEPFLQGRCRLDTPLENALRALDFKELKKQLGPLLGKKQIQAVLARRDLLLERCECER